MKTFIKIADPVLLFQKLEKISKVLTMPSLRSQRLLATVSLLYLNTFQ